EHLDEYFAACDRLLVPGGRMALQAITMNDAHFDYYVRAVDFIQKYVFPGSCLLSVRAMRKTLLRTSLSIESCLDIGQHYPPTLQAWRRNVEANRVEIRALGYGGRFERLWDYYLAYCEAGFAERFISDIQVLLTKSVRS
ncbi:MAG: SAM-dependent methyltransferase, partial [Gemmatimonadetes bacterium]|nr:SAM-dependent methyltransferase [Gemmatimonadota bacterium]